MEFKVSLTLTLEVLNDGGIKFVDSVWQEPILEFSDIDKLIEALNKIKTDPEIRAAVIKHFGR